jgi:rfaE bifunctional protein kinase chain/domain/rfaE bifunctional protein nucleotidyltransferase chain/domain
MKKIISLKEVSKKIIELKKSGKKISLSHGVFDLLHPGHIFHFEQAKKNADVLIISVTSDSNVMKGPGKPYFNEKIRTYTLASLESVDYVVISNQKSAVSVINKIKPNFYYKGSDYKKLNLDITGKIELEKKAVIKNGGKIIFTTGQVFSSSKIINKEFFFNEEQISFLTKLKKKYSSQKILDYIDSLVVSTPLVIGETIIDEYVFCKAIGKAGKEPYMVMQEKKSEKYLGGVLSIAQNLSALTKKVNLLSILGSKNNYRSKINNELNKNIVSKFINKKNSQTILKKRFIEEVDNTKLLGIYSVNEENLSRSEENLLIKLFNKLSKKSDLIILSDYGHGFFNDKLINQIFRNKKFLALNAQINSFSMGYHSITKYKKADLVLMNEQELRHELRDKVSDRKNLIKKLGQHIKSKFITVTHGKTGATIYSTRSKEIFHVPAFARKVLDKVGAGDALFPILSVCLSLKIPMDVGLFIASISAAINSESHASKSTLDKIYFKKYIEHSLK